MSINGFYKCWIVCKCPKYIITRKFSLTAEGWRALRAQRWFWRTNLRTCELTNVRMSNVRTYEKTNVRPSVRLSIRPSNQLQYRPNLRCDLQGVKRRESKTVADQRLESNVWEVPSEFVSLGVGKTVRTEHTELEKAWKIALTQFSSLKY